MTFASEARREGVILFFLLLLLGTNALVNATFGFSLPLFMATVPLSAGLAFFFPRAGFVAAVLLTIVFERFFTLQALSIGDSTYKLYPLDIILGAVFLSAFFLWLREGRTFFALRFSDRLLVGFFLLVTAIFLATVLGLTDTSLAVAFSTWKNYVFYGLSVFFVAGMLRNQEDLRQCMKLFLGGVIFAILFLVIGVIRGEGLWTEYTPLSTSGTRFLAFPHAFYFSLALIILLFSLPGWLHTPNKVLRKWLLVLSVVLSVGVVSSLMRHLWLGIGGAVVVFLVASPRVFGRAWFHLLGYFIVPVLLAVSGVWFVMSVLPASDIAHSVRGEMAVMSERLSSFGNEYDESFVWRKKVWESSLAFFAEHPWLGIGFGARVPVEIGEYQQYVEVRNMHNSWLALLVQTGIAGVVLLIGSVLSLLVALTRKTFSDAFLRQASVVVCGLLIFQGLVFFSQPYLETNLLGLFFWVTLGVARSLIVISEEREQQEEVMMKNNSRSF